VLQQGGGGQAAAGRVPVRRRRRRVTRTRTPGYAAAAGRRARAGEARGHCGSLRRLEAGRGEAAWRGGQRINVYTRRRKAAWSRAEQDEALRMAVVTCADGVYRRLPHECKRCTIRMKCTLALVACALCLVSKPWDQSTKIAHASQRLKIYRSAICHVSTSNPIARSDYWNRSQVLQEDITP
jgi:hypothetical protein